MQIKAVQQYVADLLENDEKFLIFAHHQCLLDGVEQCLRRKKVKFIRIDGNTAPHERQARMISNLFLHAHISPLIRSLLFLSGIGRWGLQGLVTAFQENESHKAAVLSIRAAGQGLTLTV